MARPASIVTPEKVLAALKWEPMTAGAIAHAIWTLGPLEDILNSTRVPTPVTFQVHKTLRALAATHQVEKCEHLHFGTMGRPATVWRLPTPERDA